MTVGKASAITAVLAAGSRDRHRGESWDDARGAAPVRSASVGRLLPVTGSPSPLRRSVSDGPRRPQCRVALPALQDLLSPSQAIHLDERFGSLQPVRASRADGQGLKACERDSEGHPLLHPHILAVPGLGGRAVDLTRAASAAGLDLEAVRSGKQRAIWCVNVAGQLRLAQECDLGTDPATGAPRYMGHPTLVRGRSARISGEFNYNPQTGRFRITDVSNAYSRYVDRRPQHLEAAADLFRQGGLHVAVEFHGHKNNEPLAVPAAAARTQPLAVQPQPPVPPAGGFSATAGPRH
jgi:hypothetical protein